MKNKFFILTGLFTAGILSAGTSCAAPDRTSSGSQTSSGQVYITAAYSSKGARLLGAEINFPENTNLQAAIIASYDKARECGMDFEHRSIQWSKTETNALQYNDPGGLLDFIHNFYSYSGLRLFFTICSPINTTVKDVPSDLAGYKFDSPEMISRFKAVLDFTLPKITNIPMIGLVIGNEVNVYLESHPAEIEEFMRFYLSARSNAQNICPGMKTGFTVTLKGALGSFSNVIIALSNSVDFISLTYYPLNPDYTVQDPASVESDFAAVCGLYSNDIYFQECGYPDSSLLNSSEDKQARFFMHLFQAFDAHAGRIKLVSIYEMTDWPAEAVNAYLSYLGLAGNTNLFEFVRSLGVRKYPSGGSDKPSFLTIKTNARLRGW